MACGLHALIWDVDGTLAETERDGHRVAFNTAFEALGLPWHWSEARYGELLSVTGGYERLLHDVPAQADAPASMDERERLARRLHGLKNEAYARIVAEGRIALRPGVRELIDDCRRAGLPMAIATTTSRSNVDALLGAHYGADWPVLFASVLCGEDAPLKKPHPQVYSMTLERLGLPGEQVLAIEDSPPGVAACVAAGVPVAVARSVYFETDLQAVPQAVAVGPGLHTRVGWTADAGAERSEGVDDVKDATGTAGLSASTRRVDLAQLRRWLERWQASAQLRRRAAVTG